MKKLILGSFIFFSFEAFACKNDFDCSMGAKCVISGYSLNGVCVEDYKYQNKKSKDSNPYGYGYQPPRSKAGQSCSFSTECGVGGQCLKSGSSLYGTCTK